MTAPEHDQFFELLVQSAVIRGGIVNIDLTLEEFNDHEHRLGELLRRFPGHSILLARLDSTIDPETPDETAVVIDLPVTKSDDPEVAPVTMFLLPSNQVEDALKMIATVVSEIGSG